MNMLRAEKLMIILNAGHQGRNGWVSLEIILVYQRFINTLRPKRSYGREGPDEI